MNESLMSEFKQQLNRTSDRDSALKLSVDWIKDRFPTFDWVGIYLVDGENLRLFYYLGAPSPHEVIPLGKGICGAAVTEEQTIIVDDVTSDPRYLACSIETKSEIVVPIFHNNKPVGEIDIDSHTESAFDSEHRALLEELANLLGAYFE